MNRKPQVRRTVSCEPLRLASTVPPRIRRRPLGTHDPMVEADVLVDAIVPCRLANVAQDRGPSAIALASAHGLNAYPRVYMSESDRMPGYLNRSQVPPMQSRASRIT